jgi:Lactate racemase N-terminal domain
MLRVAVLSGSSVPSVDVPADTVVLATPAPLDPIDDVAAAVRDALRFPLAGPPLEALVARGGRATVVVEPPVLPLPSVPSDPRRDALAAVLGELTRLGVRAERQTVLVAGGLEQRARRRQLEQLLRPEQARGFRGSVVVHDCEQDGLVPLEGHEGVPLRVAREIAETELVVTVTAAESVLHGGPAALVGACGPEAARAAAADSLLEPGRAPGWALARTLGARVAERTAVLGVSLVLDHPRPTGRLQQWPHAAGARDRLAASRVRRLVNVAPAGVRRRLLQGLGRELSVVGVLAGPPATAHAEALLRGIAVRSASLAQPVETLVVPVPWKSAHQPRDAVHPLAASYSALGIALRLWRGRPPVTPDGTVVVAHSFRTAFARPSTHPARTVFETLRSRGPEAVEAAEASASTADAIDAYRAGRAPHPLQPFVDWDACALVRSTVGRVIVAGCRDAAAARALGFVPSHSLDAALQMAAGVAGDGASLGVLAAPPYPPLVVGPATA